MFHAALDSPVAAVVLGRLLGHRSKKLYTRAHCHIHVEVREENQLGFGCVFASEHCDGFRTYREHLQSIYKMTGRL